MSRRIPVIFASLLFVVPAVALPADSAAPSNAAPAAAMLSLKLEWNGAAPLPAGVLIACRARITPLSPHGADAQATEALVEVPGRDGQCALEIPLAWRGGAIPVNASVTYEVGIVTVSGTIPFRTGSRTIGFSPAINTRLEFAIQ